MPDELFYMVNFMGTHIYIYIYIYMSYIYLYMRQVPHVKPQVVEPGGPSGCRTGEEGGLCWAGPDLISVCFLACPYISLSLSSLSRSLALLNLSSLSRKISASLSLLCLCLLPPTVTTSLSLGLYEGWIGGVVVR